ncbi:MAG: hypothetical protein NC310_02555 [Roseburia sp.]|nr:hypothetical protein [Anaeroplasma bactoclasticum]MCM1195938.1 hypothetical protein [Roseburia sp.]
MAQFLKKHAKLFYLIFGVFGFFFIVAACFFVTPYNDTAVNYNQEVLDGLVTSIKTQNENLVLFCNRTNISFDSLYQTLYNFNNELQLANNMFMMVGVVALVMLVIMAICSNLSRKKYYISNLVSGVACPAVSIIMSIVALVFVFLPIGTLSKNYDMINWGALGNQVAFESAVTQYMASPRDTSAFKINSTPLIIFGVILIVFIVVCGLLIAYNVYRYLATQKELAQGKVVEENA